MFLGPKKKNWNDNSAQPSVSGSRTAGSLVDILRLRPFSLQRLKSKWPTYRSDGKTKADRLLKQVELILNDQMEYRRLLAQRGSLAQELLDLFQTLCDHPDVNKRLRSRIFAAMISLSKKSSLYPTCLMLNNVEKIGDHPVASGGFGDIWKGHLGRELVCLKVVRVYGDSDVQKLLKEFLKEAILWRQLDHPNVLPFLGLYFLDVSKQRICLISPWMDNGNLRHHLSCHSHESIDRLILAYDVAQGLSYLHEKKIVHGDLKGDNILITTMGRACITDFGLSTVISDSEAPKSTSFIFSNHARGTSRWLAPEFFLELGHGLNYSSDIYAFGCVCYEIFTGLVPFHEIRVDMAVAFKVLKGDRPARPSDSPQLTDEVWATMQDCWNQDPHKRPIAGILPNRFYPNKDVLLSDNCDKFVPFQLWRNVQYPEMCPPGSDLEIFLFSAQFVNTEKSSTISTVSNNSYISATDVSNNSISTKQPFGPSVSLQGDFQSDLDECSATSVDGQNVDAGKRLWIRGEIIGSGSCGNVYLALDAKEGTLIAVRQVMLPSGSSAFDLARKQSMVRALERQVELLKTLKHKNIIEFLSVDSEQDSVYFLSEYLPRTVAAFLNSQGVFEEELASYVAGQVLDGLSYLHERDIIHQTIKGSKILFDVVGGGRVKISYFGVDVQAFGANLNEFSTDFVFWMAPEVARHNGCTQKADIWSLGCLIVEMLTANRPWADLTNLQVVLKLKADVPSSPKPPTPSHISSGAQDFLANTFNIDHESRPSALELKQHPFISSSLRLHSSHRKIHYFF